ncbi:MAG TPA: hypothetical protein VFA26_19535 [Gemmataceae bacterium]|nr:hypothetical protein [Gemmataceae bacterium]
MTVTTPDWLRRHDGELRPGVCAETWIVRLAGEPQYSLALVPAEGKYSCKVVQTINGKQLDQGNVYPTAEEAVRGGLEDLRKALGW